MQPKMQTIFFEQLSAKDISVVTSVPSDLQSVETDDKTYY